MAFNNIIGRADVGGIIPEEFSNEVLGNVAQEGSYCLRLGRRLRDMTVYEKTLSVSSALSTAYFVNGDTGLVQTSEVNWKDVKITAEDLAVLVPIPKNVLNDSSIPIWDSIRPDMENAIGAAIDNAQLYGTNKPTTWPDAIVTAATAAGNTVELGTGADLYEDVLSEDGVFAKVELDGFGNNASIAHLSLKGKLRGTRDANGQPIFTRDPVRQTEYALDGVPIYFPAGGSGIGNVSYPLICGEWNQLVYSMRMDMEFEVFTEGIIQDAGGTIVYNLMQQRMAAIMVVARLGTALPNPVNRVNATEATRYPFGVLTDLV